MLRCLAYNTFHKYSFRISDTPLTWMLKIPFRSFLLYWVLYSVVLNAADAAGIKFTVAEIQRLGLQANGLIQAARSRVEVAEADVVSAAAYPNPVVTVTAGPDEGRLPVILIGPATMQRQVTVSQSLENPFLRSARIGSAQAGAEASSASLEQTRADLAAQLRIHAYDFLLRHGVAEMESDIYELMEEVRRRIKLSVGVGEAARFELIRADAEVMTAASRKEAALLAIERARIALFQLTAGALPSAFEVVASLDDPVELPTLEVLREEVTINNPEILRLEAEHDRANLRIEQERATVLPALDVLYSNYQDRQFTSNIVGLSVRIPIFYRRSGEIGAAVSGAASVRQTLDFRRYEIIRLLESAWQAMEIAKRRVEMFEGGIIRDAESALNVAKTAFRLGERGFIEVLDTQRVLRNARSELLQARFELQVAAAEIDRLRAHYPKD